MSASLELLEMLREIKPQMHGPVLNTYHYDRLQWFIGKLVKGLLPLSAGDGFLNALEELAKFWDKSGLEEEDGTKAARSLRCAQELAAIVRRIREGKKAL